MVHGFEPFLLTFAILYCFICAFHWFNTNKCTKIYYFLPLLPAPPKPLAEPTRLLPRPQFPLLQLCMLSPPALEFRLTKCGRFCYNSLYRPTIGYFSILALLKPLLIQLISSSHLA